MNSSTPTTPLICAVKLLPQEQWIAAAETAVSINPANGLATHVLRQAAPGVHISDINLAAITGKYWQTKEVRLTVGFLDDATTELKTHILAHMNAWSQWANVQFTLTTVDPQVRIAFTPGSGYWSYLGTDILQRPVNEPTMNLDSFTMNTPEADFIRVVRHETGHTLGFPHEHLRPEIVAHIDRDKALAYFEQTQNWSAETVDSNVLTPLDRSALIATAQPDEHSIMCYGLPASIMDDGIAVVGGIDIDAQDQQFVATLYPKPANP